MVKMTEKDPVGKSFPAGSFHFVYNTQKQCLTFVKFVHTFLLPHGII